MTEGLPLSDRRQAPFLQRLARRAPGGMAGGAMLAAAALLTLAAPAWADGPVRLRSGGSLSRGLQAMPRVMAGTTPAVRARVNAALAPADARLLTAVKECLRPDAASAGLTLEWTRHVSVTQTGPRWLAILANDETWCGGPHPNADVFALVFDLRTGRPPDWTRLLPPSLTGDAVVETAADGTPVGLVRSAALLQRARDAAEPECAGVLDADSGRFMLWPEAGQLTAVVFGLPHAVAACADELALPQAELRSLGAASLADTISPAGPATPRSRGTERPH